MDGDKAAMQMGRDGGMAEDGCQTGRMGWGGLIHISHGPTQQRRWGRSD